MKHQTKQDMEQILIKYAGETGKTETAVDVLDRITKELDLFRTKLTEISVGIHNIENDEENEQDGR